MTTPIISPTERVEAQSAHIDWWAHERLERLGGNCASGYHRAVNGRPNIRLSVMCEAAAHDFCPTMEGRTSRTNPWRCACLCHYAAPAPGPSGRPHVGERYWSAYFGTTLTVTGYCADDDWYFTLDGGRGGIMKAQSRLSQLSLARAPLGQGDR